MRVLVVTSMYPTRERPNYGIFVADQVQALCAAGVAVDVFCINPQQTRLNYALTLPAIIRRLRTTTYQVVHTHHSYSLLLVALARRMAGRDVPLLLTNHEGEVLDAGRRTRTWHPTSFLRHSIALKRFAAGRADFTIFVSQQVAAAIAPDTRHDVIPCGVDLDVFQPLDRGRCRAQLHIPPDAAVLFFPNNPHGKGKRFALVRAAHEILCKKFPAARLVTAGGIPHESMPLYYNAADVVVQASFYEASPMIVKEALACEVPIVSTDAGDTRELVDGIPNCFVGGDDPAVLAAAVERGLGQRATGGRQRLRERELSLDQVAERVIRVYEHISNGKRDRYAHTRHS